jgi:hypothetical protein
VVGAHPRTHRTHFSSPAASAGGSQPLLDRELPPRLALEKPLEMREFARDGLLLGALQSERRAAPAAC